MSETASDVEPRLPLVERFLRGAGRFIGSALAAIGFVLFMWSYAIWNERVGGSFHEPFYVVLVVALLMWLVLRRRLRRPMSPVARELGATTRLALLLLIPLLVTCSSIAEKFANKSRIHRWGMTDDLERLSKAESLFRADSGRYFANVEGLDTSRGISRPDVKLTADGWFATVDHRESGQRCTVYIGTPPRHLAYTSETYPDCTYTGSAPFLWKDALVGLGVFVAGLTVGIASGMMFRDIAPPGA